jgi:diguanylate cyclase (GGDEF)-like protein
MTLALLRRAFTAAFHPAAALLGRLRYAQKFAALGVVLLVTLGVVVGAYVDIKRDQIAFSAKERVGVELMAPLIDLTTDLVAARHSYAIGSPATVDLRGRLDTLDALDRRLGPELGTGAGWQQTRKLVVAAQRSVPESGDQRQVACSDAVGSLQELIVLVGDESNLTLDPDIDTYYLMDTLQFRLPVLVDVAGRTADRAAVAPDSIDTAIALGLNLGVLADIRKALARASSAVTAATKSDAVRTAALAGFRRLNTATASLVEALTAATTEGQWASVASPASLVQHEAAFAADWIAEALDDLLRTRIAGHSRQAMGVGAGSGAAALLALYLFVGCYLSVARPVRRIVEALDAVAKGDLTRRVTVDTKDELGSLSHVLNDTIARTEVATDRLSTQAMHDALTGLPNRAYVLGRLGEALDRSAGDGHRMCVIFVDLDRFKIINDSLGHEAGDEVLRAISGRLTAINRRGDTVARLAGDEFVVICEDLESMDAANAIAERIVARVSEPVTVHLGSMTREVTVGASVGIAVADGSNVPEPADLLRDADVAMYHAKQRGRGRVEIFDDMLRVAVQRRLDSRNELRNALDAGEIRAFYQPIVDLASGEVVGFEALARWCHPTRGVLGAFEFIEVAEESKLVVPLGATMLRQACRQVADWRAGGSGHPDLHIAVNVSGAQFADPTLVRTIGDTLEETGLDPDALWLEITETSLMADAAATRDTLARIRGLGVHLAVDDFGMGYSSLAYLRRFPVEVLKIDRAFVKGIDTDPDDEAIVVMIVALASTLGLRVVAEGVETAGQLDRLRELGCDLAQGFLFSAPQPAESAWFGVSAPV